MLLTVMQTEMRYEGCVISRKAGCYQRHSYVNMILDPLIPIRTHLTVSSMEDTNGLQIITRV